MSHILVVDDDPDIRLVMQVALTNLGNFEVDIAVSGRDILVKRIRELLA